MLVSWNFLFGWLENASDIAVTKKAGLAFEIYREKKGKC